MASELTKREVGVVARCLKQQYEVPDSVRSAMLDRMCSIAIAGQPETAVKAFSAVVKAQELDLKALQVVINARAVNLQEEAQQERRVAEPVDLREGVEALFAEPEAGTEARGPGAKVISYNEAREAV